MHKLGCPQRNNLYASCECEAMDQREHTEQLRQFNENVRTIDGVIESLKEERDSLHTRAEAAEKRLVAQQHSQEANQAWLKEFDTLKERAELISNSLTLLQQDVRPLLKLIPSIVALLQTQECGMSASALDHSLETFLAAHPECKT